MEAEALAGVKKKAKNEGRTIVFLDESGLSERPHRYRTWSPRGQTPVLQYHFNWKTLSAIFAAFSFFTRHRIDKPGEIVVTQGIVENIVTGFTRTWQRPPTEEELQGLVRDYIREEAAYREALAMGLDRDDTVVRRRLRQKLEFLSDDLAAQAEPSDADLQAFLHCECNWLFSSTTQAMQTLSQYV